ncbi:MAG: endonuclease/exonuclease/phosphatase family protein [Nonlabens sp.]
MWRRTFQVIGIIAAVLSLVPLFGADFWWIRIFDYLHMYFMGFTFIAIILYFFTFKPKWVNDYIYIGILLGCFAFQVFRAIDYLPFYPSEVGAQENENATEITFYTANVLQKNTESKKLFEEINVKKPEIIVFTETDQVWQGKILNAIGADYPYKVEQPQDNTYGMILYSKLELVNPQVKFMVDDGIPSIHSEVMTDKGDKFQLFAIHPTPPMPQHNPKSTDRDQELMKTAIRSYNSEIPVVVMGDFNDVPWSDSTQLMKTIGKLLDARIGRGAYNTFNAQSFLMRWPLDHILSSSDFRYVDAATGVDFGSDHFPLWATLSLEPENKDNQRADEPSDSEWEQAKEQLNKQAFESFDKIPKKLHDMMD